MVQGPEVRNNLLNFKELERDRFDREIMIVSCLEDSASAHYNVVAEVWSI